jgi:hypothetical protein
MILFPQEANLIFSSQDFDEFPSSNRTPQAYLLKQVKPEFLTFVDILL